MDKTDNSKTVLDWRETVKLEPYNNSFSLDKETELVL